MASEMGKCAEVFLQKQSYMGTVIYGNRLKIFCLIIVLGDM